MEGKERKKEKAGIQFWPTSLYLLRPHQLLQLLHPPSSFWLAKIFTQTRILLHSWMSWTARCVNLNNSPSLPFTNQSNHPVFFHGVQGEHSGCTLGLVVIETKIAFQSMLAKLKHNFCFDVNNTRGTTRMIPMYLSPETARVEYPRLSAIATGTTIELMD